MIGTTWLTIAIVGRTMIGIAVGRRPGVRKDRLGIARVGAAALLVVGLTLNDLHHAVTLVTLVLLLTSGLRQACSRRSLMTAAFVCSVPLARTAPAP